MSLTPYQFDYYSELQAFVDTWRLGPVLCEKRTPGSEGVWGIAFIAKDGKCAADAAK